MHSKSVILLLY